MNQSSELFAVIDTPKGKIRLRLFADKVPLTVANFVNLAQRGFYAGLTFHRVVPDFMSQGGCPKGNGTGGPGYQFQDEFVSELHHDRAGVLSMANAGPNSNGSQFFITHKSTPWLDQKHTIFGEVVTQEDLKLAINLFRGDKINSVSIEGDPSKLLRDFQSQVHEWNRVLDQNFPNLKAP